MRNFSVEDLEILYEDNHLLVVEKPPGVPSQGDDSGDPNLLDVCKFYLKHRYGKPGEAFLGLLHRLDRPTGGVIVFGKTSKAAGRLSEQFRDRKVKKTYLAACKGTPNPPQAELVQYLRKQDRQNRVEVTKEHKDNAQKAILSYKLRERGDCGEHSLLEVFPKTGRKHQIRVQLSSNGHPLIDDVKYRGRSQGRKGKKVVDAIGLWAHRLKIVHPVRKEEMEFVSWPPTDRSLIWSRFPRLCRAGEAAALKNPPQGG